MEDNNNNIKNKKQKIRNTRKQKYRDLQIMDHMIQDNVPDFKNVRKSNMPRKMDYSKGKQLYSKYFSSYLDSLLYPEYGLNAKVPGVLTSTVSSHRHQYFLFKTNNNGDLCNIFLPSVSIFGPGNTSPMFNTYYSNQYNPESGDAGTRTLGPDIYSSNQLDEVLSYRVVSAAIHCYTPASLAVACGVITTAMVPFGTDGFNVELDLQSLTIPVNIRNAKYITHAYPAQQQGTRAIWLPIDQSKIDFNRDKDNLITTKGFSDNALVTIVRNMPANVDVIFEVFMNFEIIPKVGTVLQGIETKTNENLKPNLIWQRVLTTFGDKIVTSGHATELHNIKNMAVQNRRTVFVDCN